MESRRSPEAARAAPRKATHSVSCCTKTTEPEIPVVPARRVAMAMQGNSDIKEMAAIDSPFPRPKECARRASFGFAFALLSPHRMLCPVLVPQMLDLVEQVGRHHLAFHLGVDGLGLLAPFGQAAASSVVMVSVLERFPGWPFIMV